jgi:uncharacterized membrane protein
MKNNKSTREVIRIAGKLKEVVTLYDSTGKVLHKFMNPLMLEFKGKDFVQIIVGASILAVPIGFTGEVWDLAETLPNMNILAFLILSICFISTFIYYNYYRNEHFKDHKIDFLKRVLSTYILSFLVVGLLLTIIGKAPWDTDMLLAFKRCILVSFPASMSAAVADMVK